MSKKIIILSIIAFIVVVAGVVGALWLINNNTSDKPTEKVDPTVVVPDLTEDFGACNLLTNEQVASTLDVPVADLGEAYNSGRIFSQGGTKSQFCRYSLGSDAETNNFKSEVTVYPDQDSAGSSADAMAEDDTMSSVKLDTADGFFYKMSDELSNVDKFNLTYFNDLNQYTLSITQPSDSTSFDSTSAKAALVSLANTVMKG